VGTGQTAGGVASWSPIASTDDPAARMRDRPAQELEVSPSRATWKVQQCTPRDQFETCTVTVEQWLSNAADDGYGLNTKTAKWQALMTACSLALPGVDSQDGLRQEPRVGYDAAQDQPFFIFKASNNGTTYLVSPFGIRGVEEI